MTANRKWSDVIMYPYTNSIWIILVIPPHNVLKCNDSFLSFHSKMVKELDIVGLVEDCSNPIALAMELSQSCTKPSIW